MDVMAYKKEQAERVIHVLSKHTDRILDDLEDKNRHLTDDEIREIKWMWEAICHAHNSMKM